MDHEEPLPPPSLAERLVEQGPLDPDEVIHLGVALVGELEAVREEGAPAYGMLYPASVVLDEDGPWLVDPETVGPLPAAYRAPELGDDGAATRAGDAFALGAVLVAAAGGSGYEADTPLMTAHRIAHDEPDLDPLTGDIRPLVAACLAPEPELRPTAAEMLEWLAALLGHELDVEDDPADSEGPEPTLSARDHMNALTAGPDGLALGVEGDTTEFDWAELDSVTVAPHFRWRALDVVAATADGSTEPCTVHAGTEAELARWAFQLHRILRRYAPHAR
ncbi:hypothetical protein [Streptomyces sp. MAR4 CNX-425]|uniref:hypothetical protein n=1 Tax=Streptomyces sp. MAR4 CNX-425 TaxID=3406343 RepID=UPI003B510869